MQDTQLRGIWREKREIRNRAAHELSAATAQRDRAEELFAAAHALLDARHSSYQQAQRRKHSDAEAYERAYSAWVEAGTALLAAYDALLSSMQEHHRVSADHALAQEAVQQSWAQLALFEEMTANTWRELLPALNAVAAKQH